MAKFAIELADGGVSIMEPVGDVTPEECVAKWLPEDQDAVVSIVLIDDAAIPTDRTFRAAWNANGKSIETDMAKAKDIQQARIRRERDKLLKAEDAVWTIAFSRGLTAEAATIEARRQILRDIPQTVDADIKQAKTPDELKVIWPKELA